MHNSRLDRTGSLDASPRKEKTTTSNGYWVVKAEDHPLARSGGRVLEHRFVLYSIIGPGTHPCRWCGTIVDWDKGFPEHIDALVVDHVDGNRRNNDPANLVPSCQPCNARRVERKRKVMVNVSTKVTPDQYDKLNRVAEVSGRSVAGLIRDLVDTLDEPAACGAED